METSIFKKTEQTHEEEEPPLSFLHTFYPKATINDWNDWRWQLKNSITTLQQLQKIIDLEEYELEAISKESLPMRITPYYASLLWKKDSSYCIRRAVIPTIYEFQHSKYESIDPLGEEHDSPVKCIVHRYPDRVLFLATTFCSSNCRYCTRSRIVGHAESEPSTDMWEEGLQYIKEHIEVRDVLISGGDPLTMDTTRLEYLLYKLRRIPHVEIVRIGTKVPVVLPQRIDTTLIDMLKQYHPLYMNIHFTHPDEITDEVKAACVKLADNGVVLGSQTVLLCNINDQPETIKKLYHELLKIRVKPYILYMCDPILGSSHFRTSVEKGLEIIHALRGFTSGLAVPQLIIDAPGGGGKIPLLPDYYVGKKGDVVQLQNYEGKYFEYPA